MREIKFRGKRIENGEWVYGDLVKHYENQRRFIACDELAYTYTDSGISRLVTERAHEVNPETVGQYTGLKDTNGKEIYEGDHLSAPGNLDDDLQYVGLVVWDQEDARWEVRTIHGRFEYIPDGCVVTGNIYESELEVKA